VLGIDVEAEVLGDASKMSVVCLYALLEPIDIGTHPSEKYRDFHIVQRGTLHFREIKKGFIGVSEHLELVTHRTIWFQVVGENGFDLRHKSFEIHVRLMETIELVGMHESKAHLTIEPLQVSDLTQMGPTPFVQIGIFGDPSLERFDLGVAVLQAFRIDDGVQEARFEETTS
jgi:hypothetical protein